MISRFKELVNYPQKLKEVMQKSPSFDKEPETNGNVVIVKIAEDPENDEINQLNAVLLFNRQNTDIPQLYYYMTVLNKDGSKYTSNPKTMYKRSEVAKYLPKDMGGKGEITNKINEMFKKLMTMDKPITFEMKTDEALSGTSLIRYNKLVELILANGYNMIENRVDVEGKTYWKFSQKTNEEIDGYGKSELLNNPNFLTEELKEKIAEQADLIGFFKRKNNNG